MNADRKIGWPVGCVIVVLLACGGGNRDNGAGAGSDLDAGAGMGAAGAASPGDGAVLGGGGGSGRGPCEGAACGAGQRCESGDAGARCIDNGCDDLSCEADERCESHPQGGHFCMSAACDGDVDCPSDYHCDGSVCLADVCEAGVRTCDGDSVLQCSDDGGEDGMHLRCGSSSYFETTCVQPSTGDASCSCEDDWDCPAFTVCETGRCTGTGVAPTCSLPPTPFSDTPPAVELHWGGDSRDDDNAHDGTPDQNAAPWAQFAQVVDTPIVANLDDDNGDGLINELDFPEILFVAHEGNHPWSNGVLRAIHGGGPNKGADYFARCGTKLWTRDDPSTETCGGSDPDADSGAPVAVGDLDYDGVPEIVYTTENNLFRVLDNTGAERYVLSPAYALDGEGDSPSIANLDFAGHAEILLGRNVYVLGNDDGDNLIVTHILSGAHSMGTNDIATMVCAADIIANVPGQEIAAGGTLYRMPDALPQCATPPCAGSLELVWHAPDVAGNSGISGEGFCAVADVWGADADSAPGPDNPPDGKPEVILIDDGELTILDGETGEIIDDRSLGGGARGGAPNVDDFDGDGFMEVASALQDFYVVVDLQNSTGAAGSCPEWPTVIAREDQPAGAHNQNPARAPGGSCDDDGDCDPAAVCNTQINSCVCLHNGWKRDSDDDSSRATSSSVFDFNGDGAAEVLYNDECDFRVYEGMTGEVLFAQVSRSRTGIENPVVADVDNDGNAEVVTGMNTAEPNRCDDDPVDGNGNRLPIGPNGIRVWGDPTDTWVSARRVWNQQSYHVTNVTESGAIPRHPPESWASFGGRVYNTYRSQPRSYGVAPDLTVVDVGVSSPGADCGALTDTIEIAFELRNAGDLRVGPGVAVRFFGTWGDEEEALLDASGDPLELILQQSLEPGTNSILTVSFAHDDNGRSELPAEVRVVVDPASDERPDGAERECREDNNGLEALVEAGVGRADLVVELDSASAVCPGADVATTVRNMGTAVASGVVVRYYAGDPTQGGSVLHEATLPDPLGPGEHTSFVANIPTIGGNRAITVHAVVDPNRSVEECNEANNRDAAGDPVYCSTGPD